MHALASGAAVSATRSHAVESSKSDTRAHAARSASTESAAVSTHVATGSHVPGVTPKSGVASRAHRVVSPVATVATRVEVQLSTMPCGLYLPPWHKIQSAAPMSERGSVSAQSSHPASSSEPISECGSVPAGHISHRMPVSLYMPLRQLSHADCSGFGCLPRPHWTQIPWLEYSPASHFTQASCLTDGPRPGEQSSH